MRQAVVDASVAAKWVVEEQHSAKACLLLEWDTCQAPDHWLAEAVNVIWSKVFRGDLIAADAEERIIVLPRALAISLARGMTIHDSLYVALAEKHDIPFVTADARLIGQLAGDTSLAKRTVWVGELRA